MFWIILLVIFILLIAVLLFIANASPLGDGNDYLPLPETRDFIGGAELVEEDGRIWFGNGSLEMRAGLYVLRLKGIPYEMGYQHGVLLRAEIHEGAVPYFDRVTENISFFKGFNPLVRWLLSRYFDWAIYRPLVKAAPREYLEELKGLADGCGMPFEEIFRGNNLSELSMSLGGLLGSTFARRLKPLGCTSFAAYGDMTMTGDLIMGRNTDYWGGGLWDKYHTVMIYQPDQGYDFVNISSAGLLKCNSSMNEKGLCLGGHFLFSDDVSPNGIGFTAFELEIMKKAATVDEAYQIVRGSPRAGAFAFLIADGERKQAGVIEACTSAAGLRMAEGERIWETNHGTTKEFISHDLLLRFGLSKNPQSRFERIRGLLNEHKGRINPQAAAEFMGDHLAMCSGDQRPTGNVIGTLINMTSVVFNPTRFDFWVASGLAPVANNPYIGFNLFAELVEERRPVDPPSLAPNPYVDTQAFPTLRRYYQAALSLTIQPIDYEHAYEVICELVKQEPEQAVYRYMAAKLALKRGETQAAKKDMDKALMLRISSSERAQAHLLIGFANDLEGERVDALHCYQQVIKLAESGEENALRSINPCVHADAVKYHQKPFGQKDAAKIEISPEMSSMYDR